MYPPPLSGRGGSSGSMPSPLMDRSMDTGFEGPAPAEMNKMKQISFDRDRGAAGGSMPSSSAPPPPPPSSSTAAPLQRPCGACKFLRRKCVQECIFAPYFPPNNPNKFEIVHKIFGASNVSNLLADVFPRFRQIVADTLSYEAEMRDANPVLGVCGHVKRLLAKLQMIQADIAAARTELAARMELAAVTPEYQQQQFLRQQARPPFGAPGLRIPGAASSADAQSMMRDHFHQQQQQIAAAEMQQKMDMSAAFEREHQQQELMITGFHPQQQQFLLQAWPPFGPPAAAAAAPSLMGMGQELGIPGAADAQSMTRDHYHQQQQQIAAAEMQMAAAFEREHQQQEFMIRGFHPQQPPQQHEFGFVHDVVANDDYDALFSVSELNTPAILPAAAATTANPMEDPFGAHHQQHHQYQQL